MLEVTEKAKTYLRDILEDEDAPPGVSIRLVLIDGGMDLAIDTPMETDQQVDLDGRTILVLDEEVAEMLAGRTMDAYQKEGEDELRLDIS